MAVFSEVLSQEKILTALNHKYQKVLIIGCGGCTNESLAYTNHLPIFELNSEGEIPYATRAELKKINTALCKNGYEVKTTLVPLGKNTLCIRNNSHRFEINPYEDFLPDVILAMCCIAGTFGLRNDLGDAIPIIQITKQLGHLAYFYYTKDNSTWIDYDNSKAFISKGKK